jgi:hypothetical protein
VRVDAATGRLAGSGAGPVIAEAFLPGTEPGRNRSADPGEDGEQDPFAVPRASSRIVPPATGGIY